MWGGLTLVEALGLRNDDNVGISPVNMSRAIWPATDVWCGLGII